MDSAERRVTAAGDIVETSILNHILPVARELEDLDHPLISMTCRAYHKC